MDLFSLKGKTAVVTGALGLIGRKHCEALAAAGANVVVADLGAEQTAQFAAQLGDNHLGIEVDVTSKESLIDALNAVLNKYDSVDILVNNAAINDKFENPAMAK